MSGDRPSLRSPAAAEGAGGAPSQSTHPGATLDAAASSPAWTSWRNLWQVPTIILSMALIVVGVRSAIKPAMGHDFEGALTQVEEFIAQSKIDEAYAQMRSVIEPNLGKATLPQEARFHAVSGDLTFVSQDVTNQRSEANNRHIANQYAIAEELGLTFSPLRIERWGETMLALGDFDAAEAHLTRLRELAKPSEGTSDHLDVAHPPQPTADAHGDSAAHSEAASHEAANSHDARATSEPSASQETSHDAGHVVAVKPVIDESKAASESYGRLFRKLVETRLSSPDLDAERIMQMLAEYRMVSALSQQQRMWVASRLAELRIETGKSGDAIDGLLIEMRRLESEASHELASSFGEMHLLLGRGYHEIGDAVAARENLARAAELLSPSEPARGEALVLLGRLALGAGELDAAAEKFNIVVNEFVATRAYLPGVLGKAECDSLLGDHASAQSGFRDVVSLLRKSPPRRDVTPEMVAQRLCDRHDAALAMERAERALEYVAIAEPLFTADAVPPDVLIRLASTNRQIAENLLAAMVGQTGSSADSLAHLVADADIDPAVRYEANQRFIKAGEDYVRHASAQSTQPLSDADWGASLWFAADCFDRGGRHREAIEQFEKYIGSRPPDDSRKAEAMFRLAQAHEALMEFDRAVQAYEDLSTDRARSSFAAQCHVPLARCYLALNRVADAQKTLEDVLSGERLLQPEANDYRNALIELGRLHHHQGEYVRAIERLTEALERYPDDARLHETQYLLADSYRCAAKAIDTRLEQDSGLSPTESNRLTHLRNEQLQQALQMFAAITSAHSPQPGHVLSPSVEDLVRRAHLYQADCAFELEQFDLAVELYESASRQYSGAASSMYALVQIVNCYAALGDAERAGAAHQRALLRLQQLPESAFAEPDALMDRSAWERWLRNSPVGGSPSGTAAASAASG